MESERDRKVRQRAYELWEQRGRKHGEADDHWREAEAEFAGGSESPMADEAPPAQQASAKAKTGPGAEAPPAASPKPSGKSAGRTKGKAKG